MKTRVFNVWGLVCAFFMTPMFLASQASAADFIIKTRSQQGVIGLSTFLKKNSVKVKDSHPQGRLLLVEGQSLKSLNSLMTQDQYEYIVPNSKLHAFDISDDPKVSEQWALKKVKAAAAWGHTKGSKEIVVAVVDTGINFTHEDLAAQIWTNTGEIPGNGIDDDGNGFVDDVNGWDFFAEDNNPDDITSSQNPGHGTHCAGIVAASINNQTGVAGMANVSLMPVRFLGENGQGDLLAGVKSIDYATNNGAHVISASWGATIAREQMQPILEAIQRAEEKGVIFVAAAANDGRNNDMTEVYPANGGFSNMISVAASDVNDAKPQWSNYGKRTVDLSSPGANILSTVPGNKYSLLSGTSMATPLVSGLVAVVLSMAKEQGKTLTPQQVKALLQTTGDDVAIDTACQCRISAGQAITHLAEDKLVLVPNAATVGTGETKEFSAFGGIGAYTFTSSNPEIATVTADGQFQAVAEGEVTISVTDAAENTAASKTIYVGKPSGDGGGSGNCPFSNPALCEMSCRLQPTLPWCT